jgi:hypothetical protein
MFSRLTWKKVVEPRVVIGERMSVEKTWMRKTSAMERLSLEVVVVEARDEHLALLVEDEDAADQSSAGGGTEG